LRSWGGIPKQSHPQEKEKTDREENNDETDQGALPGGFILIELSPIVEGVLVVPGMVHRESYIMGVIFL
jgi:hypothetical protein